MGNSLSLCKIEYWIDYARCCSFVATERRRRGVLPNKFTSCEYVEMRVHVYANSFMDDQDFSRTRRNSSHVRNVVRSTLY